MNRLPAHRRALVLRCLVDGVSVRGTTRITGVAKDTVLKLLRDAGEACGKHHDEAVRDLRCARVQADELWGFIYAKEKNAAKVAPHVPYAGDIWLWAAMCADTKLVVTWCIGDRSTHSALELAQDLRIRIPRRFQLTTDGLSSYLNPVRDTFGIGIDYAQLVKEYGGPAPTAQVGERRHSPARCVAATRWIVEGHPDPAHISTSFVERLNLTVRMGMRRYTRLTNAFSKQLQNHVSAIALHFVHYNFCRVHQTLQVTPAMEAGVTERLWDIEDIVRLVERNTPPPGPRGPYRKRAREPAEISN